MYEFSVQSVSPFHKRRVASDNTPQTRQGVAWQHYGIEETLSRMCKAGWEHYDTVVEQHGEDGVHILYFRRQLSPGDRE